jgi:glutathione S-transferase
MMDSLPIVLHLDKAFPSSPLFPSGDASYALLMAVSKIAGALSPAIRSLIVPRVADYMDPRGQEYFIETRSQFFGKPLAEVRPTDQETIDELWKEVETEAAALVNVLKGREGKKGPFFEGETPGYVDLYLSAIFAFFERIDRESFDRLMAIGDGEFKALWDACEPWIDGQGEEKEWTVSQTAA